jgi:hypothetical protein
MTVAQFCLDHLVCEVPRLGTATGFAWYELDWDDPVVTRTCADDHVPRPGRVIAATRRGPTDVVDEVLPTLPAGAVTHLQFEVPHAPDGHDAVVAVRTAGFIPIPARHLPAAPSDQDALRSTAESLAALGTGLIKVVFPATDAAHLRWAETLLREWPHDRVGLSLTPAGTRQGRLGAALAGSRLVFAPLSDTAERMSASWYRRLVTPSPDVRPEGD